MSTIKLELLSVPIMNNNNTKKIVVMGSNTVDFASFVQISSLNSCLVPLFSSGNVCGWLLVGTQFGPANVVNASSIEAALKDVWTKVAATNKGGEAGLPSLESIGVKPLPAGVFPSCVQLPIHIALSHCELTATERSSTTKYTLQFRSLGSSVEDAGPSDVCATGRQRDVSGAVEWDSSDLLLSVSVNGSISPVITVTLLADETVVGESCFVVPSDSYKNGFPISLTLPLKGSDGLRMGILPLAFHITKFQLIEETAPELESIVVRLEVCDGNIVLPPGRKCLDPFFECCVSDDPIGNGAQVQGGSRPVRTSFVPIRVGSAVDWSGASCKIPIPPRMLAKSSGLCSLLVDCRDASVPGFPLIGKTRVALTAAFFGKGQSIEQWVVLNNAGSSSETPDSGNRVKLRITPEQRCKATQSMNSVGSVLMKLRNIHTLRGEDEIETIQWAKISKSTGSLSSSQDERDIIDKALAKSSFFKNELQFLNDDFLLAAINVSSGKLDSDIGIDLRMAITPAKFTTTVSTISVLRLGCPSPSGPVILQNPTMELNLQKSKGTQRGVSRLNLELAYVPFVSGKLVVDYKHMEVLEPSFIAKRNVGVEDNFTGVLRFALAEDGANFCCSSPFVMNRKGGYFDATNGNGSIASQNPTKKLSGSSRILSKFEKTSSKKKPPGTRTVGKAAEVYSEATSCVSLAVDTFEISQSQSAASGVGPMMPLLVDLIQFDSESESSSIIAVGYISTAPVFYPAVIAAASSPLNGSSALISNPELGIHGFASPNYETQVNLFDPSTRKCVAVVSATIKFVAEHIPPSVVTAIDSALVPKSKMDLKGFTDQASLELSLKGTFLAADTDKSGTVSSKEVRPYVWYILFGN